MKIGLFGGTFDPIHYGHVGLAAHISKAIGLDEVWFLVTPQNPWKQNSTLSDDSLRLEMVRLALQDHPNLIASDYEFHLPKPSYSYQTLRHLRADYPEHEFTMIIGADNWMAFDRWSHPEEILQNHPIAVFPRKDCPFDRDKMPAGAIYIDAPLLPISSTEIRQFVAEGKPLGGLVDHRVVEFIRQKGLYSAHS